MCKGGLCGKEGVQTTLFQLLVWTVLFFGLPLTIFFGGRADFGTKPAAIAAVVVAQCVIMGLVISVVYSTTKTAAAAKSAVSKAD
eukprot:SAG22_NODE_2450_length_2557_cov_1.724166_2_plen_85_part_00